MLKAFLTSINKIPCFFFRKIFTHSVYRLLPPQYCDRCTLAKSMQPEMVLPIILLSTSPIPFGRLIQWDQPARCKTIKFSRLDGSFFTSCFASKIAGETRKTSLTGRLGAAPSHGPTLDGRTKMASVLYQLISYVRISLMLMVLRARSFAILIANLERL